MTPFLKRQPEPSFWSSMPDELVMVETNECRRISDAVSMFQSEAKEDDIVLPWFQLGIGTIRAAVLQKKAFLCFLMQVSLSISCVDHRCINVLLHSVLLHKKIKFLKTCTKRFSPKICAKVFNSFLS